MRPSFHKLVLFILSPQVDCAAMQPTDPYAPVVVRKTLLPFPSQDPPTSVKVEHSEEPLTLRRTWTPNDFSRPLETTSLGSLT
jgi:hypothetical protein